MNFKLTRQHFNEICTIGTLTVDTHPDFLQYTLEDIDRHLSQTDSLTEIQALKVHGKTCIPYGKYEVVMSFSNRFKQVMPLLLNVPGFEGIRIHSGNKAEDTEGCILCAHQKDVVNNRVLNSRSAIAEVYMLITEALKTEKVFIEIVKQ